MLSKTHGEDSGIKTVTLARGVLTESSPPAAAQTPVPRISLDRVPQVRQDTPLELEDNSASAQVLNEIGIVELLEQDGRPTFIVDLGDPKNFGPGPFRIAYTNPALRANSTWLDLVTGKAIDPGGPLQPNSTSPTFQSKRLYQQFKNWLLSAATQGESLDVCLPSFFFGGIAWSCSTIRKRLRVVSASSVLSSSPSQHSPLSSALSPPKTSSTETARNDLPTREEPEPADYFGSAAPPAPSISAPSLLSQDASNTTELVRQRSRTIEHTVQPPDPSKIPQMGYNGRTFNQAKDIVEALDKHPSLTAELVLSATTAAQIDPFSHSLSSREHSPQTHSGVSPAESASQGFFDWTRLPVSEDLPSHIRFARSVDWSLTALGPIENWPPDLRQMCNLIMASPHPAAMYWGNDLVAIYNEAYVLLAGQKHPQLMGQSYRDAWVEIWDEVKDVFASARQTGEATMKVRSATVASIPEF